MSDPVKDESGEKDKELEKKKAKRKLVVEELLATEKTYLSALDTIFRHFYTPLTPVHRIKGRTTSVGESPLRLSIAPEFAPRTVPEETLSSTSSTTGNILSSQDHQLLFDFLPILRTNEKFHADLADRVENWTDEIGRAVQQECRDRSRMPSSA
eukprot:TRINITY_DN50072_c0_g1_i2.p1 TRINITY_DN50072_c0_g1~~TRINITY_DN50072_c0_g1_i2.p1  ORF type:complete len:154 (+),score=25.41 TRINITY_DN50072_c0_g1_i2:139-600(+)